MSTSGMYVALDAAKVYAAKWDVNLKELLAVGEQRSWWLLFAVRCYTFTALADNGVAVVEVLWPGYRVCRLEFYPLSGKGHMAPLWAAYPSFDSVTIGWRMGSGEDYKYRWHDWYRSLADEDRAEYKKRFPPPEYGAWPGFYEDIADQPSRGSIADHIVGRV